MKASFRGLCAFAALILLLLPGAANAQLAAGHAKFLGNVYSNSQLPEFERYWNQVTPENAGKWGSAEPQRDQMNWGTLDAAYAYAKDNGFKFRFHILIWGNQQPAWIETLPVEEQLEEIEEWFAAVAFRYPDLDYVEVVNEPLHDPPNSAGDGGGNYIEALGGNGTTGWDWILSAFRLARIHFPNAKLVINDYSIVNSTTSTRRYIEIIDLLKAEDLIDVIGFQAHAFSTVNASEATLRGNLDRLAATGLPIQVTEMDIDGSSDAVQWREYQRVFPILWEHPAVMGITLWGWRPGMWRTPQRAFLVNSDGSERFALRNWLRGYLNDILTGTTLREELPTEHVLLGGYPNPFNPKTTIVFELAAPGTIQLEIFDVTGKLVKTLASGYHDATKHEVFWDGRDQAGAGVTSGVYLARLVMPDGSPQVTRLVLMK